MQVVVKLPTSILGNLHHIQGFVAGYIAPSVSFSAAKLGVSESLDEETCQRIFGMSAEMREQVVKLQGSWQRGEDTRSVISLSVSFLWLLIYSAPLLFSLGCKVFCVSSGARK